MTIQILQLTENLMAGPLRELAPDVQETFQVRLQQGLADVVRPLRLLYGAREDFARVLEQLLYVAARQYARRSPELHRLDQQRLFQPDWFQQAEQIGYVCYTERFAENLTGVRAKIDYLQEMGVTYLHLMPLLQSRPEPNDGGYAVQDYRQIRPDLGTMADLAELATNLRRRGISLCIDLVCNHTAKEHDWAQQALAGDVTYQAYYHMFPDRGLPDKYEETVREIFPAFKPGSFTYYEAIGQWVWTTFHEYQWDLNYENPRVLGEMLDIMLHLANQGVEILRLDAVAFMWKRLGTDCENQPEAHAILQAFRALSRLAAPSLLLKAEAIVPPPQLVPYFGLGEGANKECEIAYHNVLMVALWSALAEQKVVLATHVLQKMPRIPAQATWVTYARCHDDIGWAITEEDAAEVGLDGFAHRSFLSDYYTGRFPGSFAEGTTFQFNPRTNDRRVNGSLASLAGLEQAMAQQDWSLTELAIRRILLLHNIIFAFGGTPLLYMGDEIGLLNDRSYLEQPPLADDSRWIHRLFMDWTAAANRADGRSINGRIFQGIVQLSAARKRTPVLHAATPSLPVWTHNERVLGLLREGARGRLLVLANFSADPQQIDRQRISELGVRGSVWERLSQQPLPFNSAVELDPYEAVWLEAD